MYTEYKNGLSGDINAMAQSDYASARSADQREVQEHRATHLQRRATRVSSSTWENHLVQDIYHHRNSFWAKGIMGFAGVMDSHAMHIALHATNTFTRDLMGDVSGSYGTRYFDDLHNDTSTFSDAFDFVGADVGVQVLGEIGAGILGYGVNAAADVLPSVGRNVASMFGRGGVSNSIADELDGAVDTLEIVPGTNLRARSLNNIEARKWYHTQLDNIPNRLDPLLPKRNQIIAKVALRNEIKMQTRALMEDQKSAETLPAPLTLKDLARRAYSRNLVGEKFWSYIDGGSQRSNKIIDESLGLDRAEKLRWKL